MADLFCFVDCQLPSCVAQSGDVLEPPSPLSLRDPCQQSERIEKSHRGMQCSINFYSYDWSSSAAACVIAAQDINKKSYPELHAAHHSFGILAVSPEGV